LSGKFLNGGIALFRRIDDLGPDADKVRTVYRAGISQIQRLPDLLGK
jgi:hypothetical protein